MSPMFLIINSGTANGLEIQNDDESYECF